MRPIPWPLESAECNSAIRTRPGRSVGSFGAALILVCTLTSARPALADEELELLHTPLSSQCKLSVEVRTDERPACWQLDCPRAPTQALGCDLTALHQVAAVLVAADDSQMAVVSVGEGHPILETVALEPWFAGAPLRVLCTLNPYPGTLNPERWEPTGLLLSSDVDLTQSDVAARAERIGTEHRYLLGEDCSLLPAAR